MASQELAITKAAAGLKLPETYGETFQLADMVCKSQLCPQAYRNKPQDAAVAMMMAIEAGANPVTSLNFIAVINGRPAWYADAVPGIAKAKGLITGYEEWFDGEEGTDKFKAICKVFAPDGKTYQNEFSVADAKTAGLWGKSGPWKQYPKRMMQWRARSWSVRDAAPEASFGATVEELMDANYQYRGPDRAKEIKVDTSAPPREIVTMTIQAPGSDSSEEEVGVDTDSPDQEDQALTDEPRKRTVKAAIMELADAKTETEVEDVKTWLAANREKMSGKQAEAIDRAVTEALLRLSEPENDEFEIIPEDEEVFPA